MKPNFKSLLAYLLLAMVAILSYHQLFQMYFWRDDYSTLYSVQQGNLADQAVYAYPYHLNIIMSEYFWRFFGLNENYYFGLEITLFVLASWILFSLLKRLFSDRRVAFLGSLIFSAGYLGQDALKMSLEGLLSLTALNLSLLSLLTLLIYLQRGRKLWFFCSLFSFFFALEVAAHRTSTLIIVLLAFNWIIAREKRTRNVLFRSIPYLIIFAIQYFFHPSVFFFNYKIGPSPKFWGVLTNFSPLYLFNPFGTFWNMIVPSDWQDLLNRRISIYKDLTLLKFWIASVPSVLISLLLLFNLKLIRPSSVIFKTLILWIFSIIVLSFVLSFSLYQVDVDKGDLVSIVNGVVFFVLLLMWIIKGACKSRSLAFLSLFTLFGMNLLFFLNIPERVLVSYNRYLLAYSFTPAMLLSIFVSKELYLKDSHKRRLAMGLLVWVSVLMIIPRLVVALSTQQEFVTSYSQHSKRMYQQLRSALPNIQKRQLIYIEGSNKELSLSVGDAARVGYLGSEAAFATHYQTQKENIILPQTLGEIPQILAKNPDLSMDEIHTFIYDEQGLRETSQEVKKILSSPRQLMKISLNNWQKDSTSNHWKLNPSVKITSFFPLSVKIPLKFSPEKVKRDMEISWSYNTVGLLDQPRSVQMAAITDGKWHEYELIIPGGGEYLKELVINFPSEVIVEFGETEFSNFREN